MHDTRSQHHQPEARATTDAQLLACLDADSDGARIQVNANENRIFIFQFIWEQREASFETRPFRTTNTVLKTSFLQVQNEEIHSFSWKKRLGWTTGGLYGLACMVIRGGGVRGRRSIWLGGRLDSVSCGKSMLTVRLRV